MTLHEYLSMRRGEAGRLAPAVGCTTVFLRNVANGHRFVSESIALAIERETAGQVTVAELRPKFAELLEAAGYVKVTEPQREAA